MHKCKSQDEQQVQPTRNELVNAPNVDASQWVEARQCEIYI